MYVVLSRKCLLIACISNLLVSSCIFFASFFPMKKSVEGYATLEGLPPVPGGYGNPPPRALYGRLVLIIVDALRADFLLEGSSRMSYVQQLLDSGSAQGYFGRTQPPTVTLPRIKAMTTGGIPGYVDVVMNFGSKELREDNLISQLHRTGKRILFFGDDTWIKLFPNHFIRSDGTTSFFVTDYTEVDTNVTRHLDTELENHDWDVMILHYLGLDHIGHLDQPSSSLVTPKLQEMDSAIRTIHLKLVQQDKLRELPSLILITGDHGMDDKGSHGGVSYDEVTVPVVLMTSAVTKHEDFRVPVGGKMQQTDLAPTLSLLLGIPIPKNSIGAAVPNMLAGFTIEEKLRALQINAHQVLQVFQKNAVSWKMDTGYLMYEEAFQRHANWLSDKRDDWKIEAELLVRMYHAAARTMGSTVSLNLTKYDTYGMMFSIICLWLNIVVLLLESWLDLDVLVVHLTRFVATLVIVTSIAGLAAHLILCMSQFHDDVICTAVPFSELTAVVTILAVCVLFCLPIGLIHALLINNMSKAVRRPRFSSKSLFLLGFLLYVVSLSSSSYIEKEQEVWYFFITTMYLIFTGYLIKCKYQKKCMLHALDVDTALTKSPESGSRCHSLDVDESCFNNEISRKPLAEGKEATTWTVLSSGIILLLCWISRNLNQHSLSNAGDWLNAKGNKMILSAFVCFSLVVMVVSRWQSGRFLQWYLLAAGFTGVYCFHAANTKLISPLFYKGSMHGITEARFVYIIILAVVGELVKSQFISRASMNTQIRLCQLFTDLQTAWILLTSLLMKPHNICLSAMLTVQEFLLYTKVSPKLQLPTWSMSLVYLCMAQASFFYQGNSNSLSTVDIKAGYAGLEDYQPVIIGCLIAMATYTGPVFWFLGLARCETAIKNDSPTANLDRTCSTLMWASSLPLLVYAIFITINRYHLFIWTVFSPKLLYLGCSFIVSTLFVLFISLMQSTYL